MELRELTPADRDQAARLWVDAGLARPWNDPGLDFDLALAGDTSAVLGLVDELGVAATAMVGDDGHRGWIYYVATRPSAPRAGLGRRILHAAEAWLRDRGVRKVNVMVRDDNPAAIGFYEHLGYENARCTTLGHWLVDPPT